MTTEMTYLAWSGILTLLIRVPWMFNKAALRGLAKVSRYPNDSEPLTGWAHRIWVAHEDATQNLVVFTVLVIGLQVLGLTNHWTQLAAAAYFWARVVHFSAYAMGIPYVKTAAFVAGFGAQLVLAWQLAAHM